MEVILSFFRDFLSGPLYIVVVVFSVIGIIACIGYLAEASLKQKELEKKQKEMYAEVHFLPTDTASASSIAANAETVLSSAQINQVGNAAATNIAQSDAVISSDVVSSTVGTTSSDDMAPTDIISDEQQ